jgi:hypothetical protein
MQPITILIPPLALYGHVGVAAGVAGFSSAMAMLVGVGIGVLLAVALS